MRYHFGSCFYTKHHLNLKKIKPIISQLFLTGLYWISAQIFPIFYWSLVLYTLCPLSVVILILLFDQSVKKTAQKSYKSVLGGCRLCLIFTLSF